MNSTGTKIPMLMKLAIAYIAGVATFELYHHYNITAKLETMSTEIRSLDSAMNDSATAGEMCPCDNSTRYNVDPREESLNIPIPTAPECSTMVYNANPHKGVTPTGVGAWFSKITIDNMFCHKPDANGIYVYKAITAEGTPTYVVEAARTNKILSTDDGSSFIYYSRAMCPTMCGVCGM